MPYQVSATFRGKRITTDEVYRLKPDAQRYADETNRNYPGANARVINAKKKR